ncbi:DNA methyltransferase [Escherichia coli]
MFIDWLFEVIAECHHVLKKQGSMYIMAARKTCPLSISSAASFSPSKVASSGHMTVLEYRRKNTTAPCRPILMMVKDAKNYTFNGDAILVEAKTE